MPTGIRIIDGGLRIEGYPDAAHYVVLKSPKGQQLNRLRTHQAALIFCERAMQELRSIPEDRPNSREAILTGVVVKFFSCFGKNKAIGPLSANRVFSGQPDALECFRHWKAVRDKHIVHDESALTVMVTGLVLGATGEVQDVISLKATAWVMGQEDAQMLYNLIDHTLKHVEGEASALISAIFGEVNAMTPTARLSLPKVVVNTPQPSDVTTGRST